MRRLIGKTLLLLFSFPLIAPVFAVPLSGGGGSLPACCRRNGAHHCTGMQQADSSGPRANLSSVPQHCPAWPAAMTTARHSDVSLHAASLIFAEIVSHPATRQQLQARARVALDRSRQKRGPPATKLL